MSCHHNHLTVITFLNLLPPLTMYSLRQKYAPVGDSTQQYHDDSESNKALLEEAASSQNSSTGVLDNQRRSRTRTRLLIGLNLALFCVSVLVGTLSCFYVVRAGQNINNSLLKKTSYYCLSLQPRPSKQIINLR